jgi:hypothetical protein
MGLLQPFLARYVGELLVGTNSLTAALEDLTLDQLHARPHADANSIGFDAWHVFRTVDNIVHFVFYREPPVWRQQGLAEAWGLPRNVQGTGLPPAEAYAMRFPEPRLLAQYGRDVAAAIVPRLEAMDDAFLTEAIDIAPLGATTRLGAIGTSILTHGYAHLGHIALARTLLGRPSLTF